MGVVYLLGQLGYPAVVLLAILALLAVVIAVSRRYMHRSHGAQQYREIEEYEDGVWGFK